MVTREQIPHNSRTDPEIHILKSFLKSVSVSATESPESKNDRNRNTMHPEKEQTGAKQPYSDDDDTICHHDTPSSQFEQRDKKTFVTITRERKPFNEFEENDTMLYATFPFLFLYGSGLTSSGSVPKRTIRPMMLQFHNRFAKCIRFVFCLFDQMQRHAACRFVAFKVKNSKESFAQFAQWVNDASFTEKFRIESCREKNNASHQNACSFGTILHICAESFNETFICTNLPLQNAEHLHHILSGRHQRCVKFTSRNAIDKQQRISCSDHHKLHTTDHRQQ